MYQEISGLLFHPDGFFARKQNEEIHLLIPAVIVGIGSIVTFLSPVLEVAVTRGDISGFFGQPTAALYFLLLPFALWLVMAAVLYVVSRLLGGTGSFPATLQNTGYGYLPQTLLSPFILINGIARPWIAGMQPSIFLTVLVAILGAGLFLGVFWSAALWTSAMEKTHGISRGRAIAGPALVVLFSLLPLVLVILSESAVRVPPL
ncbi:MULTISPECIES: Yip1 family protein [unclassified Methanoregula]|uniref:Yip1 family protein n=1 Tax=unclassified Methanoregula TaxID=2649730 RepID=UPI0009D58BE0|nr:MULTISPECIES: Yip1 family protein [unclassified Methanoregula]OPX62862.1 MAG: Yip1 domain protein [Methanoregula sp. PtaB.Bin085]OPY35299.1 MAG: Yip1 domain protein [Methanoregula sp. PtaU1.Bin006]